MIRVPLACLLYLALSVTSQCAEPAPQETSTGTVKAATDLDALQQTIDKVDADKAKLIRSVADRAKQIQEDYQRIQQFVQRNAPWLLDVPAVEPSETGKPKPKPKPAPEPADELPTLSLPESVTGPVGVPVKVTATTNGAEVKWLAIDSGLVVFPTDLLKNTLTAAVWAMEPGEYRLIAYTALGNKPSDSVTCRVIVTGKGPRPPPPDPKLDPDPDPEPPIPAPTGFRVLFVSESSANHTREQINILRSTAIADYLNRKCVKDASGRAEWRSWDKDVTLTAKESQALRDLWEKVKPQLGTLPQVVIVTNGKGQVFNLPATEAETLALLKKHGGE